MKERDRRYYNNIKNELYIYGNTVRSLQVQEDPNIERKEDQRYDRVNRNARRNREYANSMNWRYVIFLIAAVMLVFGVCTNYLKQISTVTAQKKEILGLERQALSLKSDNNETERRLESSIDMEAIKRIAMEELGMVYASQDQVVLYHYEDGDYVRQYEGIPKSEENSILENFKKK